MKNEITTTNSTNNTVTKRFYQSKLCNGLVYTGIMVSQMMNNVFAAGELETAKSLLSKAATAGGGLWAVWGLVSLGLSIKDHNGPGIQGAIWQLIGGAIIIAAGTAIAAVDLTMA